jgi:hypothetical protein
MNLPPARLRAKLWLIWLLVAFGALNLCGSSLDAWRSRGDPAAVDDRTLRHRQTGAELMMTVLRDDNDIERYFAYAEATLGRPYAADFILPLGRAGFEGEPNPRRMTTPARPLVPWRDFVVEYPPGMMITALAPALVTSDADTYYRLFTLEAEAALTLAVWLAVKTSGRLRPDAGSQGLAQALTPGYDLNDQILTLGEGYWVSLEQEEPSVLAGEGGPTGRRSTPVHRRAIGLDQGRARRLKASDRRGGRRKFVGSGPGDAHRCSKPVLSRQRSPAFAGDWRATPVASRGAPAAAAPSCGASQQWWRSISSPAARPCSIRCIRPIPTCCSTPRPA